MQHAPCLINELLMTATHILHPHVTLLMSATPACLGGSQNTGVGGGGIPRISIVSPN